MVSVGIGPDVGGGTTLAPGADPSDGLADIMVSRATSAAARLGYLVGLGRGQHTSRDDVHTFRGRTVTVAGEEFWTSADGELSGPERRRTWRVESGAYRLIRPRTPRRP